MKKTRHILDNELGLRSFPRTANDRHPCRNPASCVGLPFDPVGRFDELTHFFNVIHGLFRQPALTLAFGTHCLTPPPYLSKINMGLNMFIDTLGAEHRPTGLLDNVTVYGLIDSDDEKPLVSGEQRHYLPVGIGRFNSADRSLMFGGNHQWTSFLTSALRFGTMPNYRLRAQVEYQRPTETCECIAEHILRHSSYVQLSCLSRLWQGSHCRIDGGFDLRNSVKESSTDIGLRLARSSDSLVLKFDVTRPFEHYLIGFQRHVNRNLTMGLLAEKMTDGHHQRSIKFSAMSRWSINRLSLQFHTLMNSENEMGLALTHQIGHIPLTLQAFGLYSWTSDHWKWGVGLQFFL